MYSSILCQKKILSVAGQRQILQRSICMQNVFQDLLKTVTFSPRFLTWFTDASLEQTTQKLPWWPRCVVRLTWHCLSKREKHICLQESVCRSYVLSIICTDLPWTGWCFPIFILIPRKKKVYFKFCCKRFWSLFVCMCDVNLNISQNHKDMKKIIIQKWFWRPSSMCHLSAYLIILLL